LGLKNGDRLESVNGFELQSPEKVLEAYTRVRTADNLVVQINRDGHTMTIDYKVQ
jgi:general secretion pathway protein C